MQILRNKKYSHIEHMEVMNKKNRPLSIITFHTPNYGVDVIISHYLTKIRLSINMLIVRESLGFISFPISPLGVRRPKTQLDGEVIRNHITRLINNKLVSFGKRNLVSIFGQGNDSLDWLSKS